MTFLLNPRPKFIYPFFEETPEGDINYKPFHEFPDFSPFITLSPILASITGIESDVEEASDLAQSAHDLASTALHQDMGWGVDEATIIGEVGTNSISTNYVYGVAWFTANTGSAFRWRGTLDLSLGGTFKFWYHRFPTGGIATLSVNGNNLGTVNFYNAANSFNNFGTLSLSASVVASGRHTIDLTNTSAGTGGGRGIGISKIWYTGN